MIALTIVLWLSLIVFVVAVLFMILAIWSFRLHRKAERAALTGREIRIEQAMAQDNFEFACELGVILAGSAVVAVVASVVRDFLIALQTTPVC